MLHEILILELRCSGINCLYLNMSLKEKILLGICVIYWLTIGISFIIIYAFVGISIIGFGILVSLILLLFFKSKYSNIIGICGLYTSSISILIYVSLVTINFSRLNELINYLPFLFSIINFIAAYWIYKLCRIKNEMLIE